MKKKLWDGSELIPEKDMEQFYKKIKAMADQEFGTDCDGDSALEIVLVDRTRENRLHYRPLPYSHPVGPDRGNNDADVERKVLKDSLEIAEYNLALAWEDFQRLKRQLKFWEEQGKPEKFKEFATALKRITELPLGPDRPSAQGQIDLAVKIACKALGIKVVE